MVISKSDQYLLNKDNRPTLSMNVLKSVSDYRRTVLEDKAYSGIINDGTPLKKEAALVASSVGIVKNAQITSGGQFGYQTSGTSNTMIQAPEIYSPLWLNSNLNLPRDRATINAWCRAFFALNGFVHNAINLHSTYPISKLNIKCANKKVENFFNEMIEEIDLFNVCIQIAQEYWLLGEAFPYAELNESKGKWSRILLQNPDYVVVNKTVIAGEPNIQLKPDEHLKKIITSNHPNDVEQRKMISPYIVQSVRNGGNIPVAPFNISHLSRKISPYSVRGTGLPVCVFRQLMLFDQLRESKYVQAQSMVNPLTLVKIGGSGQDGFKPTHQHLEEWRDIFTAASMDKDFKIFTHDGVSVEKIGSGSGIYDISGDITQLQKEIFIGLQVPSVLMDGGSDTTYANGGVALDILKQRYMAFRNMMSAWLKRKIFAPIAKINDFYDFQDGQKTLIIPEIDWNHMAIFDANDYIQNLITLNGEGENKKVSLSTVYRSLGLDMNDEMKKIRRENIDFAIVQKEKSVLEKMSLTDLRAIEDEDEIEDIADVDSNNSESEVRSGETNPDSGGLGEPDNEIPGLNIPEPMSPAPIE